jgi:hypothetical protein
MAILTWTNRHHRPDYKFTNIPLNLSLDWKPELDIIPDINFVLDAFALSARFTF